MTQSTNLEDFVWMYKGKHTHAPTLEDINLILAKEEKRPNKNSSALLMLHGFSSSPAVFRLLTPQLNRYATILIPQLAGHGTNIRDFEQSTANAWLDSAIKAYEHLTKSHEKVDVLGLSLGGLIACHLAHQFPINHLYLLAPALDLVSPLPLLLKLATYCQRLGFRFIRNVGGRVFNSKEEELLYRLLPLTTVIEILNFIQNYQHQGWTHPTTLFLGGQDNVVNSTSVLNKLTNCLNLDVILLNKSGHVLPLDSDLDQMVQLINQSNFSYRPSAGGR